MTHAVRIGPITLGGGAPLVLIGGPCAIENETHALMTAERLTAIAAERRVPFIYKSSYDKANRSSINGYRGPGLVEGLRILHKVRDSLGVPVLSDVHQVSEVDPAADVLDVIQIPAFLCRQTDLILAAAATGKPVNVKKGLRVSGLWAEKQLVEIIELSEHPYFVAGQFHPELRSRPWDPHPLFAGFVRAALQHGRPT